MESTIITRILCLLAVCGIGSNAMAQDAPSANSETSQSAITGLVTALRSADFATRLQASQTLKTTSVADLEAIADLPNEQLNAEVAALLFTELDARYMSDDRTETIATSEILERLVHSERLLLADGARRILNQRWQRRVDLTANMLKEMGAEFKNGSFSGNLGMRWGPVRSRSEMQLLIGEEWKGGDKGLEVMQRLDALTSPGLRTAGLMVWLLEGHPLNDEQRGRLRDFVGESRINERSRVALGILGEPNFAPGVRIFQVSRGSSAAEAKLQVGDVLIGMLNEPPADDVDPEDIELNETQKLKDFDHLVERLKAYREGDKVWLIVRRGPPIMINRGFIIPRGEPPFRQGVAAKLEVIEVTLKGWDKLEARPN